MPFHATRDAIRAPLLLSLSSEIRKSCPLRCAPAGLHATKTCSKISVFEYSFILPPQRAGENSACVSSWTRIPNKLFIAQLAISTSSSTATNSLCPCPVESNSTPPFYVSFLSSVLCLVFFCDCGISSPLPTHHCRKFDK